MQLCTSLGGEVAQLIRFLIFAEDLPAWIVAQTAPGCVACPLAWGGGHLHILITVLGDAPWIAICDGGCLLADF
ncbi:MAG: hypothetical protein R2873_22495 [Caldilineaceae bacterium]